MVGGWYERIAVTVRLRLSCYQVINLFRNSLSRPCENEKVNIFYWLALSNNRNRTQYDVRKLKKIYLLLRSLYEK